MRGPFIGSSGFALPQVPDDPATQQVECSVLHLELAPIHLALLGLHVDTSAICLNGSLGQSLAPADAAAAQSSVCTGDCEVLELVLGPLNLSLLGLNVSLDDCNGGPVQSASARLAGKDCLVICSAGFRTPMC
jgi:hypothetical protein